MNKIIYFILQLVTFTSLAQQSYYEPFTVGNVFSNFTLGSINQQNGWESKMLDGQVIGGCTISEDVPQSLTSGWGISGASVLRIAVDADFSPSQDGPTFGCYSPVLHEELELPSESVDCVILLLIDKDDNSLTTGSVYELITLDGNAITSKIGFYPDGSIKVTDNINGVTEFVETGFSWIDHEWAPLKARYNFIAGTITYYFNGQQIYSGGTLEGQSLERLVFFHDNTPGSTAYFSDIFIVGGDATAGLEEIQRGKFLLYPNPARDNLIISSPSGIPLAKIAISDTGGRLIKSLGCNTALSTTINTSDIPAGIYFVSITSNNLLYTYKIIIN